MVPTRTHKKEGGSKGRGGRELGKAKLLGDTSGAWGWRKGAYLE